jgi:hypothetical protein
MFLIIFWTEDCRDLFIKNYVLATTIGLKYKIKHTRVRFGVFFKRNSNFKVS